MLKKNKEKRKVGIMIDVLLVHYNMRSQIATNLSPRFLAAKAWSKYLATMLTVSINQKQFLKGLRLTPEIFFL